MSDIINLLPEGLANQIAAGEVIQRPSSVVKELLENAIDADATHIRLIIKNAGKTLIQIVDNGKGMSEVDARMSFERHATSKIHKVEDLFRIQTKGFRGEALASIAAIAQVDLKTRRPQTELGTHIEIAGTTIKKQEACQCPVGSNFSVKNLFFNVPARRKFLKSDPIELKHIVDEFQRVALAHPEIFFEFFHNENEVYHLPIANLRQRIVGIFGKNTNEKVIPVLEETDYIKIDGFVGKPNFTKKRKADQYFFLNQRFIKSNYLSHAVKSCYEDLITPDQYPFFVINIEMDPEKVDINVHPTKQEVKFEEERLVYNYIKVAVKHALGRYSLTPTLDFGSNINLDITNSMQPQKIGQRIENENFRYERPHTPKPSKGELEQWSQIYQDLHTDATPVTPEGEALTLASQWDDTSSETKNDFDIQKKAPYQLFGSYILSQIKSGVMVIDQQAAHERILYEKHLEALQQKDKLIQKELFPITISLSASEALSLGQILDSINTLGFEIEHFGGDTFLIRGIPAGMIDGIDYNEMMSSFIHQYESNLELSLNLEDNVARSMAYCRAIKRKNILEADEMTALIDQLFACKMPYKSPSGKKCFITLGLEDIQKQFLD